MKIYKYPLPIEDVVKITLPYGASILDVQIQHGDPYIWAMVEPDNDPEERVLCIFGTGQEIPMVELHSSSPYYDYIGTFQMKDGDIVFHVFELSRYVHD